MKTTITIKSISCVLLVFSIISNSFAAAGGGGKLQFRNASLQSGVAGADGAVYRFAKVDSKLDVLVTIKGRSNSLVYLKDIDMTTSGFDKAWQPVVGYNKGTAPGAADWWMEFELAFVDKKDNSLQTIDNFSLSAIDIDGNGDKIREDVSLYNFSSYLLEANSVLVISNINGLIGGLLRQVGARFDGPTLNFKNIDTSGTAVMVTAQYDKVQKFTVRAGAVASAANGAAERMYSFYFQDFSYNSPVASTLPVDLMSFDARLQSSGVELDWKCDADSKFSHFVVERSENGKDFHEKAMIFAEGQAEYTYSEKLSFKSGALLYFRLKMVDQDGTYKYSTVRVLKINSNSQAGISAFPNPATTQLRISIPPTWQNQQVTYELVNVNGVLVTRSVNNHASQTETFQLGQMKAGTYFIRLTKGTESVTQQIAKQ